ncbi:hypothetical protein M0R45_010252 [Rubus argutus]|uniref:Uncharacterized protein n=1 Tax=Rubus argutus TaxID=59490 RepID=A0AAW1Y8A2_RUBAR
MSPAPNNHEFSRMVEQAETNQPRKQRRFGQSLAHRRDQQPRRRSDGRKRPLPERPPAVLVCLLKFQQIAASVASITNSFVGLIRTANRRIASPDSPADSASSRLYRVIKGVPDLRALAAALHRARRLLQGMAFQSAVAEVRRGSRNRLRQLAPRSSQLLGAGRFRASTNLCIVLFLIQSVDRVILGVGCFSDQVPESQAQGGHGIQNDVVK